VVAKATILMELLVGETNSISTKPSKLVFVKPVFLSDRKKENRGDGDI